MAAGCAKGSLLGVQDSRPPLQWMVKVARLPWQRRPTSLSILRSEPFRVPPAWRKATGEMDARLVEEYKGMIRMSLGYQHNPDWKN